MRLLLHHADLSDSSRLVRLVYEIQPDEIYHLGAQSHVRVSFDVPEYTNDVTGHGYGPAARGDPRRARRASLLPGLELGDVRRRRPRPRASRRRFIPRSPYAVAKVTAYWITVNYRESYGMHASNGILFNHESERRGETFVTRKITRALAAIHLGLQDKLFLGNLDAQRDWGYAPDFTDAMWRMLQQDEPDDYVIATGEMHSVREFLDEAAQCLGMDWQDVVEIDPKYYRPGRGRRAVRRRHPRPARSSGGSRR